MAGCDEAIPAKEETRRGLAEMTEQRTNTSRVISDVNQIAMAWAQEHAGERLGTKWYDGETSMEPSEKWPVSELVRLAIRKIMTEAFSKETSMSELTESIRAASGFTKEQSRTVAETEGSLAMCHGNLAAWKRTGIVKSIKWRKSSLHKGRDVCDLNADAGSIPLGQAFPSGDEVPPAHIGCCCCPCIAELNEPKRPNSV
jgi:hypothetical protein